MNQPNTGPTEPQERDIGLDETLEPETTYDSKTNYVSENPLKKSLRYTGISLLGLGIPLSKVAPFVCGAYKGVMDLQGLPTHLALNGNVTPYLIVGSASVRLIDNIPEEDKLVAISAKLGRNIISGSLEFMVGWSFTYGLGTLAKKAFF